MKAILLGNGTKQGVLETVALLQPEIERCLDIVAIDLYGKEDMSHVQADLAIIFGGDGSILRAAHQMGKNQIPVLAVHLGTLSFLSTLRVDELISTLERPDLLKLPIIEHLLLNCKVFRQTESGGPVKSALSRFVLNEVLMEGSPGTGSRLVEIELHIDDDLVTTYRGDGLILSTPVGSTAHNLSAGGPILRKDIDAVVISPVSPHTLSNRPLVESPDRHFELRVRQKAALILDGTEVARIEPGDAVRITRGETTFKTFDIPGYCYYKTLRNKLGWNGSLLDNDYPAAR